MTCKCGRYYLGVLDDNSSHTDYNNKRHSKDNCGSKNDPVNKPAHYTSGKIDVIDFIEDQKVGYHLGNVIKYVARAGKKDPTKLLEDLKKAKWYLDRYIETNSPKGQKDE